MYIIECTVYAVHGKPYDVRVVTVQCTSNNVLCTARINKYSVCRTLYIIQCTMYTVLCTACNNNYSVRRTLYSVHRQCTLYYAYY